MAHLRGIIVLAAALFALHAPLPVLAAGLILRISTENTADHVQTAAVARFAAELQRRAGDRLVVVHHFNAFLFRDRDVIRALRLGKVEMAVPGTWQLDSHEPSVSVFLLPAFYGRDAAQLDQLRDGPIGAEINARIHTALDLHVLGRWIDLGHAHVFGVGKAIDDDDALRGLRIRVAGGEANLRRLVALGAEPRVIPWPDLPRALGEGSVDGILTTYETIASARLWDMGVTSAFEDRQYFAQYVPLVSDGFWRQLPDDLKQIMIQVWEDSVGQARAEAALAQQRARTEAIAHGMTVVTPSAAQLNATRARLMAHQAELIGSLGLDPALVARAVAMLDATP